MPKTAIKLRHDDHCRRMSLAEFDHAEVQEGRIYELSRGTVIVWDIPHPRHLRQIDALRQQLYKFKVLHPEQICAIAGISDCKMLLFSLDSERHPDIAVYKSPHPGDEEELLTTWIPDLVIEVVSPSSEERDYVLKREEYLQFGVREYWIVDAEREEVLVLRRRGKQWLEDRVVKPPEIYRTRLLPGFEFDCARVFAAAEAAGR